MEETLEQLQARHRKEQRDLQSRITQKKKQATKKTRKGVNDECAQLEKELKERQELELRKASGEHVGDDNVEAEYEPEPEPEQDKAVNDLSDKVQSTTITPPEPEPESQEQSQNGGGGAGGGGGGKKRNRQKERLARRAAEQEAAAIAAESEAANMVDHRSLEKEYMTKEFKAHALTEKEIAPDGHCLFSAVADQLEVHGIPLGRPGPEPNIVPYKTVRKTAAEYMQQHRDDYEAFMEEGFEEYVHKIRDTAEWGGQLELSALANAYGVEIKVVQDGRTETIAPKTLPEGDEKRTLWLAYYRRSYGLGEHYNSLRSST